MDTKLQISAIINITRLSASMKSATGCSRLEITVHRFGQDAASEVRFLLSSV